MTLPEIDTIIGWLQHVFRSREEAALLELASAGDEMLTDIQGRPSVKKFWAALQAVSAIESAKQPSMPAPELPNVLSSGSTTNAGGHPSGANRGGLMPPGM